MSGRPNCLKCENEINEVLVLNGKMLPICKDCFEKDPERIMEMTAKANAFKSMMQGFSGKEEVNSDDFLTNLNAEVAEDYTPVLFRDEELDRITQILLRKTKCNPIIIGEAGVGKTAVAEELAYRIEQGTIPHLKGYTIFSLDLSALMSNTRLRGEFEEKINALLDALDSKSILFIDEMHLVMGAGSGSQNEIDFANLLKPHLSRGKIKIIGATTLDEYQSIEKDPAFNRRFHPVKLTALDKEQALVILKELLPIYEEHHRVSVSDKCLELIVNLSDEYIKNRHFPDKAIDILDEACSTISLKCNEVSANEIKELSNSFNNLVKNIDIPDQQRNNIVKELEIAQSKEQFSKVDEETINLVVEKMTNIPITKINNEEKQHLLRLEDNLNEQLIGQEEAVKTLARAVKRSRLKIKKSKKPTVLFFAGPTGVGKTESVKALNKILYGTEESLIQLDMSEYMDNNSFSKLIGAAPGLIGYDEEGILTKKVRQNPYSIVLLDEFEKAHPSISDLLLQTFSEGRLTDSKGRIVDFSNTIIILTSNLGVQEKPQVGFGATSAEDKTMKALQAYYKPEFLNRIDEFITFNSLSSEDMIKIVDMKLIDYKTSLSIKGIELKVDENAKSYLAKKGYDPSMGARPLNRIITREMEDLIVDHLIENDECTHLLVEESNGKLKIA
ncbi:ATP-dependent Clp protease ATP-binding subunit [Bacillus toyonensis]|uniref:ATP-dependent Clp protease ATP-binding subunit n=1 Tax=Bacillus toyonensis TaxID=155322 RepID=UPI002E1A3D7B|nr:ATP-dependent Clp protease ATP-binding subunit [Bacillus toyonensis]